ncbi:MAG: ABC transporter permease [Nitrospirae bacterium]|nr:ABC transporter permease [Nitrospirota bacterium]
MNYYRRIKKAYRLLPPLIVRDIRERYAGSAIGVFWTFIQPVLTMLVFWLVFSKIMKIRIQIDTKEIPYLPFLLSGLLPWIAFQEGVIRGASSILEKGFIIKKVFYPAEVFPVTSVVSSFLHHAIGLLIFLVVYFIYNERFYLFQLPFLFILIALQLALTLGISFLLSALSVYLRDILQIIGVVFQVLFYLTTIIYPITSVPAGLRPFVEANPITLLIEGYHSVILYYRIPSLWSLVYLAGFAIIAFIGGYFAFRKLKSGFADVL